MNYVTKRAISAALYLIKRGVAPHDAIQITLSKYQHTKVNTRQLEKSIKKEIKNNLYYEEEDI